MKRAVLICMTILLIFVLCSCEKTSNTPNVSRDNVPVPQQGGSAHSNQKESPGNQMKASAPSNLAPVNPGPGDPGDTNQLQWWGTYKSDDLGFSIEISEYSGTDFWVEIYLLRNGSTILAGRAALSDDDKHLAIFGDLGLYLYEDFSAIDIFASEDSEWTHMRGQYIKIE